MRALRRKLLRDSKRLWGQIFTISLVIGAGIASYTSLQSCYSSLLHSKSSFYAKFRFADLFAKLERAPRSVAGQLASLPDVVQVYDHIVEWVTVPLEGLDEPATAHIVSLPEAGPPRLNAVDLRRGRWPDPDRTDEVVLLASFAQANGLDLGSAVPVVMNERLQRFRVVGLGVGPEYVFPVQGGLVTPDEARFAVLWMPRSTAAAAFGLQGAFSAVALSAEPNASIERLKARVDRVLKPYGGSGAYDASEQPSNHRLEGEFVQLRAFAVFVPMLFLGVSALLVNVVLSRLVLLQRTQIATLKAIGYGDRRIVVHYLLLISSTLVLGSVLGVGGGAWLGRAMTDLYLEFFRFPSARFFMDASVVWTAVGVSAAAGAAGGLVAMRSVLRLPPAEAMRPASPPRYRRSVLEVWGLDRLLTPSMRIVVREIGRHPIRTGLSALAMAASMGIVVSGRYSKDAIDHLMRTTLQSAWREDLMVELQNPVAASDLRYFAHVPGVRVVEPQRTLAVRFESGHRRKDALVYGYRSQPRMRRPMTEAGVPRAVPRNGVLLTERLSEVLQVRPGDVIRVESREETRPEFDMTVAGFVDESFGLAGHVNAELLAEALGENLRFDTVLLRVERRQLSQVQSRLRNIPSVATITRRQAIIDEFREQTGEMLWVTMLILAGFASTIVVGVVYNNARVALSARARDLATMRVLGFHRNEISTVLLGELAVQVAIALPIGAWFGRVMSRGIAATIDPDQFRLPLVITGQTHAFAALVTLGAAVVAGSLVRRRLARLDLIGVLKTRE